MGLCVVNKKMMIGEWDYVGWSCSEVVEGEGCQTLAGVCQDGS